MSEPAISVDRDLDARGLNCPLPILRAKKALSDLASGQMLRVVATDPGAQRDFQAFSKQTGNELVKVEPGAGEWAFYIRRR